VCASANLCAAVGRGLEPVDAEKRLHQHQNMVVLLTRLNHSQAQTTPHSLALTAQTQRWHHKC